VPFLVERLLQRTPFWKKSIDAIAPKTGDNPLPVTALTNRTLTRRDDTPGFLRLAMRLDRRDSGALPALRRLSTNSEL